MKMDNHIMVDCETVSTRTNAAIVSIGAAQFSLSSGEVKDVLYLPIELESYDDYSDSFHVDLKTVAWWMRQDPEVQKQTFLDLVPYLNGSEVRFPIYNALMELQQFCQVRSIVGPPIIWSTDETADAVWLENAYRAIKKPQPWTYQGHRCFRTATEFARELGFLDEIYAANVLDDGVKHNAAADAKWQAQVVVDIYRSLKEKLGV